MDTLLATITARLLWTGNPILESQEIDLDVYWIWVDRICRIICNQLAISNFDPLPRWLLIFGTSTRHRPTRPATTLKTILAWLNSIFHWDCADYNQGDNEPAGLPSPRWKQASKLFDSQSWKTLLSQSLYWTPPPSYITESAAARQTLHDIHISCYGWISHTYQWKPVHVVQSSLLPKTKHEPLSPFKVCGKLIYLVIPCTLLDLCCTWIARSTWVHYYDFPVQIECLQR